MFDFTGEYMTTMLRFLGWFLLIVAIAIPACRSMLG